MKHAIALLIALLFSTTGKGQIIVGYSFAQTQFKCGKGLIVPLDDGSNSLVIHTEDGDFHYFSTPSNPSVVNKIVLVPSSEGYAVWVGTIANEWEYTGDGIYQYELPDGQMLYAQRITHEGEYVFVFW